MSSKLRGTILWIVGIVLLLEAMTSVTIRAAHLHFNYTDSVPAGLYRESRNTVDSYAGFCLSTETVHAVLVAGLETIRGDCPGRIAPVLKPLHRATEQHPISLTYRGFVIDGKVIRNTAPKRYSRAGSALEHFPFGTYTKDLWAISDHSPDSYDSRYFGPVDVRSIRFYARPVLTY